MLFRFRLRPQGLLNSFYQRLLLRAGQSGTPGVGVLVCENMAFSGDFQPVLAKHSKNFSLQNALSIGVDQMQRNFDGMRKQVEAWRESKLSDTTAKLIIYRAFVESDLEVPRHLAKPVHDLHFSPKYEEFQPRTMWSLSNAFTSAFKQLFLATAKLAGFLEHAGRSSGVTIPLKVFMTYGIRLVGAACVLAGVVVFPRPAEACSLVLCLGRGMEVQPDFTANVKLEGKPLLGVTVEVHPSNTDQPYFMGQTDSAGIVKIRRLPPGDYWIRVTYLGISAGYHCFHVRSTPSLRAKGRLNYRWGDYATPMRVVGGNLREWQPGTGGTPLWNLANGRKVPISGAVAELQNARTKETLRSTSDSDGDFSFPPVTEGTYVLHFEGTSAGNGYGPTDLLIAVSHTAKRDTLNLVRQETGCGDVTLQPDWK